MSQENVEIVRRTYEAINRGDVDAGLQNVHSEYELHPGFVGVGMDDQYLGREGAQGFFEMLSETWETVTVESTEILELSDDRVLSVELWCVRGRDGIEIVTEVTDVYTFRDGLIARVDGFRSKGEALEAAGLSERA